MEERLLELYPGLPADDVRRLALLPCMFQASRIEALPGGITNRNYRAVTPQGDFVIRLSDPDSSLLAIDRVAEHRNSLAAAYAGAGAPVVDYLHGQGVLVVGFLEGRTWSEEDVRRPENFPRIAEACRRLHEGPAFASEFNMFDIQARYLLVCRERGFRLPPRYEEFLPAFDRVREAMQVLAEPLVPCNNDLLARNFIDDDERLWLIDYEYSGNNEASFEIANVWSESTLPLDHLEPLVSAYWGRHAPSKVARARLWGLASQYGWMLWASIQQAVSPIDFDFWTWGLEKYERAVETFDGPDLERLLDEVACR
ncbi:MAG: phosphotransferase [Candidatus Nanopelagicales bacterium]